jgi:bifunctional non-homologous end joining protein LigD
MRAEGIDPSYQVDDLRDLPLIERQAAARPRLIGKAKWRASQYNDHFTGDGPTVFKHFCRMGWRASKRADAPYRSGRSRTWLKSKNSESAAVQRDH